MNIYYDNYKIKSLGLFSTTMEMEDLTTRTGIGNPLLLHDENGDGWQLLSITKTGTSNLFYIGINFVNDSSEIAIYFDPIENAILLCNNYRVFKYQMSINKLIFDFKLPSEFYTFWQLDKLNLIVIICEINVLAIDKNGNIVWHVPVSLITKYSIVNNNLLLTFDDSSHIEIDMRNGSTAQ